MNDILWTPSTESAANSQLSKYMQWLKKNHGYSFQNYESLWQWSVDDIPRFWSSLWEYFKIIDHANYSEILSGSEMPNYQWFKGSKINYTEHIFRNYSDRRPALIALSENQGPEEISWKKLSAEVASVQQFLIDHGVSEGDRVAAYLPNIPQATYGFLAANGLGAIWASCSPDFGSQGVLDRLSQIQPKILIITNGYRYNNKIHDRTEVVKEIIAQLPSVEKILFYPNPDIETEGMNDHRIVSWSDIYRNKVQPLRFNPVDFDHPMWILYSSGTTGLPKSITHSHGGMLLEHLKYLTFHNDVKIGDRFFWFTTTGWMMWNFLQASLLVGGTAVLYDGSPGFPNLDNLWNHAAQLPIHHFGTSAPFIIACMKQDINLPKMPYLRSIGSTGSPLPPEAFDWIYSKVAHDVWLCSMSGGTDVCTAFVGGCPIKPVIKGKIQCRGLGINLLAYDEIGNPVLNKTGEMVITKPMPNMPIYFWNDENKERYRESYFDVYPGVWRHGDWVTIDSAGMITIHGRSDATLNRHGVRIGTAEIYRVLDQFDDIVDSLIVNLELKNGDHFMPLFLKLNHPLTDNLKDRIKQGLKSKCSPRHVPDQIIEVPDIPYTISGKKMETPVKKILLGRQGENALQKDAMRNPESLAFYCEFAKQINP
ncbi:acetoacetate--CoA ligase [Membranihabitans marinus]|uniref:acetoacetate--CoA ligase n=1 Tax=Membranihabitans marinus TaxID=1227546 RepID=UPI001F01FC41|nr:acetoacetate--CoA ligase [Membranihabitans marinus]